MVLSSSPSSCSHLNFRFRACFGQGVPWHSSNYRGWTHSEMHTWHNKNTQWDSDFNLIEELHYYKSNLWNYFKVNCKSINIMSLKWFCSFPFQFWNISCITIVFLFRFCWFFWDGWLQKLLSSPNLRILWSWSLF